MSMGRWLKAHRKQVITHTSIIVGFVLLTIFVAEPLFDRLEQVAGESQLYETTLPAATNNIQYSIDKVEVTAHTLEMNGWAFIMGMDPDNSEIYIVLKSRSLFNIFSRTYIFTAETMIREDVTQAFKELNLNLDYSGFTALIPTRKIAGGEYTVGIYITKGDIEALQYTGKAIAK